MDVRTLLFTTLSVSIVLSVVAALINRDHPSKGMVLGVSALGSMAMGTLSLASWMVLGTHVSVVLGYTSIAVGLGLSSEALLSYQERQIPRWALWLPVPVLVLILLWFMSDIPKRTFLNAIITVVQVLILFTIGVTGRRRTSGWGMRIVAFAGIVYGGGVMVRGVAIFQNVTLVETLLTTSWVHSLTYLLSLNALVLFAVGLIAMSMEQTASLLARKEDEIRSYVENAHDVIYELNLKGEFKYISPNLPNLLGYRSDQVVGHHFSWIVHPDDLPAYEAFFAGLLTTMQRNVGLEYRALHLHEGWRWHDTNASPLLDKNRQVSGILGVVRDIHERKLDQSRLEHLAHHDSLTGLLNRRMIVDRCEAAIDLAKSNGSKVAVMFIDLNEFKEINDLYGHDIGDKVLQEVATRLTRGTRSSDSVGRLGGDEYLILLSDNHSVEDVLETARRIQAAISQPHHVGSKHVSIGCSIGISIYPQYDVSAKELVHLADQAMYESKRDGGRHICLA